MGRVKKKAQGKKETGNWICPVCGIDVFTKSFTCTHCSPPQWIHNECGGYTVKQTLTTDAKELRCNNCKVNFQHLLFPFGY